MFSFTCRRREKKLTEKIRKGEFESDFERIPTVFIPCSLLSLTAGYSDRKLLLNDVFRWLRRGKNKSH